MLNRFFFMQNTGKSSIKKAVTFTVKEWFLDPDNSFTDTEVDVLPYMTVKIDGVEQLTDAQGQTVFNLAPGTHTYEVYDMVRYLTTRKGTVTVVDAAVAVDVKIYACLYTPTQVQNMIDVDGYIPVATASELDGLRNSTGRRMGQGTIHDTITDVITGVDKKYVQVNDIDLNGYANWVGIGEGAGGYFTGEYLGSLLTINNINISTTFENQGLFSFLSDCILSDINIINANVVGVGNCGILCGNIIVGSNTVMNNVKIINSSLEATGAYHGLLCGWIRGVAQINDISIINSTLDGASYVGSIAGNLTSYIDCYDINIDSVIINATSSSIGGLFGYINTSSHIRRCYINGVINVSSSSTNVGGIAGYPRIALLEDCFSDVDIIGGSSSIGGSFGLIGGSPTITNIISIGNVNPNGSTNIGGLVGRFASGTITNSYYDTQASNQSDTGKGLPRTTAQLKNGTADSFINPDGTADLTEDPANAMFTGWDDLIWDFTDNTKYPTLL